MSNNNDDELGIEVNVNLTKAEQKLKTFEAKWAKGFTYKVDLQFDQNAAAALTRLRSSFAGLSTQIDQSAQTNAASMQKFFGSIQRSTNGMVKNADKLGPVQQRFAAFAQSLANIQINQRNATNIGNFFRDISSGSNSMLRLTKNIDAVIPAMTRLMGRLSALRSSGGLEMLKNLPANMGFSEKGGFRMSPIKIVAPNGAEWDQIKSQMEKRITDRPIKARIEPEMSKGGLQKFQNLLIALSFGQFSQNLEQLSRKIISSFTTIEGAQTTLGAVYRDNPRRGQEVYKFASDFDQRSSFSFEEALQGTTQFAVQEKQMKKYGFNVERAMNMAGELAAAFGQGKPGAISDIQTGISRLMTGDQNGFEILDRFGISRSTLKQSGLAVGKHGVSLKSDEDIKAVLEAIERFQQKTTGGNLIEKQNQTIGGQISNLQSQAMKTQAALFEPLKGSFLSLLHVSQDFLSVLETAPPIVRGFLGGITLLGAGVLKVAQQISSVGLVFLGMNNAGLFDRFKTKNLASQAGGTFLGDFAGEFLSGSSAGYLSNRGGGRLGGMPYLGGYNSARGRNNQWGGTPYGPQGMSPMEQMALLMGGQWAGSAGMGVVRGPGARSLGQRLLPTFLGAGEGAGGLLGKGAGAFGGAAKKAGASLVGFLSLSVTEFGGALMTAFSALIPEAVGTLAAGVGTAVVTGVGALAAALTGEVLAVIAAGVAVIGTLAYALANPAKVLSLLSNPGQIIDGMLGGISSLVYGDQSAGVLNDSYQEKWHGGGKASQARQAKYARGTEIMNMTGTEMRSNNVTRNDLNDQMALAMQRQRDLEAGGVTATEAKDLEQVNKQLDGLRQKRNDYNNLIEEANALTETELQTAIATNQAKVKLGTMSKAEYAQSLSALTKKRELELAMAKMSGNENDVAVKTQAWLEALVQVKDAWKDVTEEQRASLKIQADLNAATGGTASEAIDFAARDINLMPESTPEEKRAKDAAKAGLAGQQYNLGQVRKNRRIDAQEASGDTLGAQIKRAQEEGYAQVRASGKEDRPQIEEMTNAKIRQLRFTFYQDLLKLAQDNLSSLNSIENQRLATAKNNLDAERALREQALGRGDVESAFGANAEMAKLSLRQQEAVKKETDLKLKQAKSDYEAKLQSQNAALELEKSKPRANQTRIKSMERGIELTKETYRGTQTQIRSEGSNALKQLQQGERFRSEDVTREATESRLGSEAEALQNRLNKMEQESGQAKESRVELLKQELDLELKILKANLDKALLNPKLTKAEKINLKDKYSNDVAAKKTEYAGKASDSQIAGAQTTIDSLKSVANDPNMKPKDKLLLLRKQMDLEKGILFQKYQQDSQAPGADKLQLQKTYLKDLNDLQLRYLDSAKAVTGELDAQNQALLDRYNNKGQKSGMFAGDFTMGEVFGVDQLAENLQTDSEYSQMQYKKLGTKSGYDPFSLDKFQTKDYANQQKQASYGIGFGTKVPSSIKELQKADMNPVWTLKVEFPDGKTQEFKKAYNKPPGK